MQVSPKVIPYENLKAVNAKFETEFKEKFSRFLEKGWYILGEEVATFEESFAKYCGAKYCIGVANGLDALELGLRVLDLPSGSEIIVPSNTYIATILAVVNSGLIPVLVEPDIQTYNINAALIEEKITAKTKAIMVVHLYGQTADMSQIMQIAQKNNLEVVEDCAQAHGASFRGQIAGTFGKIGAYSFYPTKNLGALGDGGAIITSDKGIYLKVKALRNYGSEKKYYNKYIGRNSRLDEIQAAFLNIKLPALGSINNHKRRIAAIYTALLKDTVITPVQADFAYHTYHIYNIRSDRRDELQKYLLNKQIHTEVHYPVSPNNQAGYKSLFKTKNFPISEEIHATTLSLPISYATSEEDAHYVSEKITDFFKGTKTVS